MFETSRFPSLKLKPRRQRQEWQRNSSKQNRMKYLISEAVLQVPHPSTFLTFSVQSSHLINLINLPIRKEPEVPKQGTQDLDAMTMMTMSWTETRWKSPKVCTSTIRGDMAHTQTGQACCHACGGCFICPWSRDLRETCWCILIMKEEILQHKLYL